MHLETQSAWTDDNEYVYIDSIKKTIKLIKISETTSPSYKNDYIYKIGIGDQIAITVWGLPDIFPVTNIILIKILEGLMQMAIYFLMLD